LEEAVRTKLFRILVLVGMLTVTIGPSTAALAADVPTSAQVSSGAGGSGAGVAPNIECKWELPDANSSVAGIQYGQDDSSAGPTLADGSTAATPCRLGTASPVKPTQADNAHQMIQVRPNAHDLPEQRRVEVWAAIDPPTDGSGISTAFDAVSWNIYHPDGTLKIEIYGTWVAGGTNTIANQVVSKREQCASVLGTSGNSATVVGAAVATGQVATSAAGTITDGTGLLYWCTQSKQFWRSEFRISKHQPCGEYRVVLSAKNSLGSVRQLTNFIDVVCFSQLELDFNAVNFGPVTAGFGKVIDGNVIWENPPGGAAPPIGPTVRNTGNSGMQVRVTFSDMCVGFNAANNTCPTGVDKISVFDACFAAASAYNPSNGNGTATTAPFCKDPIAASIPTTLGGGGIGTTLCANRLGKLDLSIHPQSGIAPGNYVGNIAIVAVANAICLTDAGHSDTTTVSGTTDPNYPGQPVGTGGAAI